MNTLAQALDVLQDALSRIAEASKLIRQGLAEQAASATQVPSVGDFLEDEAGFPASRAAPERSSPASTESQQSPARPRRARPADGRPPCKCGNPLDDDGKCRRCDDVPMPPEIARTLAEKDDDERDVFGPEPGERSGGAGEYFVEPDR